MILENIVKKVERQYYDIVGTAGAAAEPLRINDTSVEAYLKRFQWDHALYQHQGRPLGDIVGQIQAMAAKVEDDLKTLSTSYTEKLLASTNAVRKRAINIMTSDFEDFLKPEDVARLDPIDSDTLLTVVVAVPKSSEEEFKQMCDSASIGADIASFGGPDWSSQPQAVGTNDGKFGASLQKARSNIKGSPVVPGSYKRIVEEGEYVLYGVTILKGHYEAGRYIDGGDVFEPGTFVDYLEPVKNAFREKKYIVRDFSYDPSKAGDVESSIETTKGDLSQIRQRAIFWCRGHFGEVYHGWVHLKVIRAFVESVLRYGLPVDFTSFFLSPNPRKEATLTKQVTEAVLHVRPELKAKRHYIIEEGDDEEEDNDGDEMDKLPYVCQKFTVIGATVAN